MATVTAAIVLYNRAGYIATLLQSLFDAVGPGLDVRAVVVDNGSEDEGADVAGAFGERVTVIRNERNLPLPKAVNQSIRGALAIPETDYVLVLNDDVSILPDCLQRLVDVSVRHPNSLLTPLQLQYDPPHNVDEGAVELIQNMGDMMSDMLLDRPMEDSYRTSRLIGAVMMAPRFVFEHIGLYDELFLFYGPDSDYCNRAKWLGFEIRLVPLAHALHAHGRFMHQKTNNKIDYLWRWRRMTFGRYLLCLKNPNRPLWRSYLATFGYTIDGLAECLSKGWLRGAITLLHVQLQVLISFPRIRSTFREHFDRSKRLPTATENT